MRIASFHPTQRSVPAYDKKTLSFLVSTGSDREQFWTYNHSIRWEHNGGTCPIQLGPNSPRPINDLSLQSAKHLLFYERISDQRYLDKAEMSCRGFFKGRTCTFVVLSLFSSKQPYIYLHPTSLSVVVLRSGAKNIKVWFGIGVEIGQHTIFESSNHCHQRRVEHVAVVVDTRSVDVKNPYCFSGLNA